MKRTLRAGWLVLAVATAALDLWSKTGGTLSGDPSQWPWKYKAGPGGFDGSLDPTQFPVVENWLYVRTWWNEGGAWSMSLSPALLFWGTLLAVPLIALWIFWPRSARAWDTAAKALILGGAIGNLYDRWRWNMVRDWIDVCFGNPEGWHYPTFNVADVGLVVGIVMLLLGGMRKRPAAAGP